MMLDRQDLMLLENVLPAYHFRVRRHIEIQSTADRVFEILNTIKPSEIPLFNTLFWIRSIPGRLLGLGNKYFVNDGTPLVEQALSLGFVILGETPNQEIVFGTIGQWWKPTGAAFYRFLSLKEFREFHQPGYARVCGNFYVDTQTRSDGLLLLTHETRVEATDSTAHAKFKLYWRVIYPGVALLRRMLLESIKAKVEAPP
jgi:hypothetical protein